MFSNKVRKIKKKKKKISKLVFITGKKRVVLCINFIKYLVLFKCGRKKKNITHKLFSPLFDYIVNDKGSNMLKIKYKIYKQKLMQLQG